MGVKDLLAFLTGLPLGGGSIEGAARSIHLAPLAGLVVGALVSAVYWAALQAAPPPAAAAAALAAHLAATGGLHLDGFADYSEAVLARARGRRAEEILGDPRRGGMALAAVSTLAAARLGLLASGPHPALVVASYVAAAWSLHLYLALHPPPRPEARKGLGEAFRVHSRGASKLATSTVLALALASLLSAAAGSPLAAASALAAPMVAVAVSRDSASRLGRASGDAAGFAYEASQATALAAAIAIAR